MTAARFESMTIAAEIFESERERGTLRGDALEAALRFLHENGRRKLGPRGDLPPRVVVVPPEVDAIVVAAVKGRAGHRWEAVLADVLGGRRYEMTAGLRHEIGWVLHGLGYGDSVIAMALHVDRTTVVCARRTFARRLERDQVTAKRVERVVGAAKAAGEERAAC